MQECSMHIGNQLVYCSYKLHYLPTIAHGVSDISHHIRWNIILPILYSQCSVMTYLSLLLRCFIWKTFFNEECLHSLIWKLVNPNYHSGSPAQTLLTFSVFFGMYSKKNPHVEFAFDCTMTYTFAFESDLKCV